MKRLLLITILLLPLILPGNQISVGKGYSSEELKRFGFTLLTPDAWKKYSYDLGYKRIIHFRKKGYVRIKITAVTNTPDERNKWSQWKKWYIKGIGRSLMKIAESDMETFDSGLTGKVILFQYKIKRTKIIQKILYITTEKSLLIIECRAPVYSYKKYSEIFNTVTLSVMPYSVKSGKSKVESKK